MLRLLIFILAFYPGFASEAGVAIDYNSNQDIGEESVEERAVHQLELFDANYKLDSAKAFEYYKVAHEIIKYTGNDELWAGLHYRKALYYDYHKYYDSALFYYQKAVQFSMPSPGDIKAQALANTIFIYYDQHKYSQSIELGHELLELHKARNDSTGIGNALKYIGLAYDYVDEHDTALNFYMESLSIYRALNNKERLASIYHNLAGIYNDENDKEGSIEYYNKALEIVHALDDKAWLGMLYNNLGLVYENDDPSKAEQLFSKGLMMTKDAEDLEGQGFAHQNLAGIYFTQKKYALAEKHARISLSIGEALKINQLIENNSHCLYKIYHAQGNLESALEYLLQANRIKDSVYTENNSRIMSEMQAKYENDKKIAENALLRKEAEIKETSLQKKNTIITLLAIVFLILVIASFAYYRSNFVRKTLLEQIKKQKENAEHDREIIEHQAEKLKEHDIVKSRFFANVSHDLRTPLTLIMGSLSNIRKDNNSYLTDQSDKDLEIGHLNCKRLLFLANEINELNRLDEGNLHLRLKPINAPEFVKLIVDLFSSAATSKSVSLFFENSMMGQRSILADPDHFERIIYNLLTNALKFTPAGGRITVSTAMDVSEGQNFLAIKVSDTGKGIHHKSLPYVFNRFYQSILNEYSPKEGFGMGLALVKELVEMHDGKIFVSSKINVGTTFTIKFPIAADEVIEEPIKPKFEYDEQLILSEDPDENKISMVNADFENELPPNAYKVLIVEDHKEIREYLDGIVKKNYETRLAANGKVAIQILEKDDIDVIVTDLMMPWMDGFELLELLKNDTRLKKIPVMVVSARTSDADRDKVLKLGVNDFLIKPFKSEELLTRIRNLINNKEQWNEELGTLFINNEGKLQQFEKDLLKKVEELVIANISNSRFSVLDLAYEMAASERQVYRMIKKLSGMTPYEYIKEVRWQYAEYLLKNNKVQSVSEAAKKIGMSNVTDFKRQFSKRFNKLPSEYIS